MHIGVQQIALQQITIIILRPCAEIELAEVFVSNPRLTAERQVPAAVVQGDVFQPVQPFGPSGFVFQIAPVFIVSQRLEGRRRLWRRRRRSGGQGRGLRCLGKSLQADAREHDDQQYTYDHLAPYFDELLDAVTTLKLKRKVPSTPYSRSQIGIICSVA